MNYSIILLTFATAVVFSQSQSDTEFKIKSTEDFEIRADTNNILWKKARWINLPHRGGAKNYLTRFKMLYSETGLYCMFFCSDKLITSTLKQDFADLYNEDVVEAFFWTDESTSIYFEYELSPYNYELPIIVPNFKGRFLGWLPWHYEGPRRTRHDAVIASDNSWIAVFFIPYQLLAPLNNVPPKKGTKWRVNFYRLDYDEGNSRWSWQQTRNNFHDFEKFGTMTFD